MNGVTLRVFSGIHLGAEIALTQGSYVLGTDDSCDLIFEDSSLVARHAVLRVSEDEGRPLLSLEPLDGPVSVAGTKLQQEQAVPPRHPFQAGLVTLAWTDDASAGSAAWQEVEDLLARMKNPETADLQEQAAPPLATTLASDAADAEKNDGSARSPDLSLEQSENAPAPSAPRRSFKKAGRAGALLALVLLGLLSFTWNDKSDEISREERVRTLLREAGYEKLSVTGTENGVTVTGRIASDRERGRLLRLAQFLHFPVYLDVTVRSDSADAVRASFNTLGLFPEVTELPPSAHPGLLVKGYIQNGVLEEQALTEAIRNVPDLQASPTTGKPVLALFRDIRHEEDVQMLLLPALAAAGLDAVKTEYLPGKIVLHGAFTPQTKAALEKTAAEVQERLGVPVRFDIINDSETLQPAKSDNIYAREEERRPAVQPAASSDKSGGASFRVTSVSMGALKFITLAGGERVFEGGELPGGYRLESISVDALTLSRNNQTTTYPLRGSHE
ncbi:type III secretion system inner membrane ring subunit SctD [uncultured Mailhella sp.]|uniref:type III secretion system inner membrane ring subunit SctD n=1 Tax=uncultured Mailhella sp. TaxID=1981031 RepID=UPI0025ECED11|nr:type III secretion system inner membrane ring subunit SctD [uncultured Mailhella sp.]